MSDRKNIMHDGHPVSFRQQPDGVKFVQAYARFHDGHPICPLCKELMTGASVEAKGGSVWLMIGNQAGVPNRTIHHACFDACTAEFAFTRILADWTAAQRYKDWFENR